MPRRQSHICSNVTDKLQLASASRKVDWEMERQGYCG
jgi:hypothetical protein